MMRPKVIEFGRCPKSRGLAEKRNHSWVASRGNMVKQFAVKARNVPERHLAQTHCFIEQRIEHRREVARRGIDDLQDFGGRGLLLQGFAQFSEQPRVLVGYGRLALKCLVPLASQPRDLCFLAGGG